MSAFPTKKNGELSLADQPCWRRTLTSQTDENIVNSLTDFGKPLQDNWGTYWFLSYILEFLSIGIVNEKSYNKICA